IALFDTQIPRDGANHDRMMRTVQVERDLRIEPAHEIERPPSEFDARFANDGHDLQCVEAQGQRCKIWKSRRWYLAGAGQVPREGSSCEVAPPPAKRDLRMKHLPQLGQRRAN